MSTPSATESHSAKSVLDFDTGDRVIIIQSGREGVVAGFELSQAKGYEDQTMIRVAVLKLKGKGYDVGLFAAAYIDHAPAPIAA